MKTPRHGSSAAMDSTHGIDLAPMLDFVMNLLIFFIITAILVKEVGVTVARPEGISGESVSVNIVVLESGEVFFNGRLIDMRAVRANIEREKAANANIGVTVQAGNGAATGELMRVIDQVRLGGLDDITFVTAR